MQGADGEAGAEPGVLPVGPTTLVSQGAEAVSSGPPGSCGGSRRGAAAGLTRGGGARRGAQRVFACTFLGEEAVLKHRFSKKYRHPAIDRKLTKQRLVAEARAVVKARRLGVAVPSLLYAEAQTGSRVFRRSRGRQLKLGSNEEGVSPRGERLLVELGATVAKLHDGGMIHGDLTTSNAMVDDEADGRLVMIDFGLSTNSDLAEDKGVDLYVMERAFTSAHAAHGNLFERVLSAYKRSTTRWSGVFNKYAEVKARGRKRTMVG